MLPSSRPQTYSLAVLVALILFIIALNFYNMGGALIGQMENATNIHNGTPVKYVIVHPGIYWLISMLSTSTGLSGLLHFYVSWIPAPE